MSVVVGSGYTLHYFDERTGEHVQIPLEDLVEAKFPSIAAARGGIIVTHDEVGSITEDVWERAKEYAEVHDLRRVVVIDHESARRLPERLDRGLDLIDFDSRALRRAFAKPDLDNLSPYAPLEKRRPDWQDRGRQHKNRKKRSWRR